MRIALLLIAGVFGISAFVQGAADPPAPAKPASGSTEEFFEKRVRPLLATHCFECHDQKKQKGDLRLDTYAGLMKGGTKGAVVVPGDPAKSRLIQAIRREGELEMPPPPAKKLPDDAIETLTAWVKMGAPWPGGEASLAAADAWKTHWAFQPVKKPAVPVVKNQAWMQSPVDAFILAKLEAKGLSPAPSADRRTLIRRAYYDLHGLPPTFEEIEAFVNDPAPDAFAKLVDRLLASPRYGERWGRHWLDLARYADERGYVGVNVDRVYAFAYTYRDWVIRAFNEDLPYDQFIIQQLAADQLVQADKSVGPTAVGPTEDRRALAAMGFLTVGRRFINNVHDIIDDRIDVVTRSTMGLTVTCARCHDHKYDPIPTADYYSLYGVFASSQEPDDLPLLGAVERTPQYEAFEKERKKLEDDKAKFERDNEQMKRERPREFREKIKPFENKIKQLEAKHPGAPPRGMVMVDRPQPVQPHVFVRGDPRNQGPSVPRQFPAVLAGAKREPFKKGSGRLELAQAIVSKDNPLTARVLVNRAWLHHFGKALVRTPSDFGLRSDPPTHPELLDYLATRFVEDGWSIKKLHRLVMFSSAYQQSSVNPQSPIRNPQSPDPENTLLSHMNRQRFDFEQLRDSLLAVAGDLDATLGGLSIDLGKQPFSRRRTVYGFIDRQNLPAMFRTFDFASPDTHSPQRFSTTVPQQALFLLNGPFAVEQVKKLAARQEVANAKDDTAKVQALYRLVFGRNANEAEVALGVRFVNASADDTPGPKPAQPLTTWERYVQVLLLSNEFAFVD